MPRRGVCDASSFVTEQTRYCDHCYLLLELSDKYLFHFTEHGPNKPPTEQNFGELGGKCRVCHRFLGTLLRFKPTNPVETGELAFLG